MFGGPRGVSSRLAACFVFLLIASGCSVAGKVRSAFGGDLPIKVTVVPGANEDTPIAVDLLLVYDQKLMDDLLKMPAATWFTKKEQFLKDHENDVVVTHREWAPGQAVAPLSIAYKPGVRKVVLFADYVTEGDHRAVVMPQQPFHLVLGERDFSVEAVQ
jgi:type VI secretion system protein